MSTTYVTRGPMTMPEAVARLTAAGCVMGRSGDDDRFVEDPAGHIARDPGGNYMHLDVPSGYVTLVIDHEGPKEGLTAPVQATRLDAGTGEAEQVELGLASYATESHDGSPRVMGEVFGRNDGSLMVGLLDMVSEHDEDYDHIVGAGV